MRLWFAGLLLLIIGCFAAATVSVTPTRVGGAVDAIHTSMVDMAGRTVSVPSQIDRVTCIHSIPSHMVWLLATKKMISIDIQFKDRLLLIPEKEQLRLGGLPTTGIYRKGIHREDILELRPDIIFSMSKDPRLDDEQRNFRVPVFAISKDSLGDYAQALRFVGKLLGNKQGGDDLAAYWLDTMSRVGRVIDSIPSKDRPRVYYAQRQITTTVGDATIMASIVRLAGGVSYCEGMSGTLLQRESERIEISLEEVLEWDPEVIIARHAAGRDEIMADPRWRHTTAVRNGRVYAVTKLAMPDRIQSLMGLVWMANTLHPNIAKFDLLSEVRQFYKLFCLNGDVSPEQLAECL